MIEFEKENEELRHMISVLNNAVEQAKAERDRYLSLLREITKVRNCSDSCPGYEIILNEVQHHIRQELEEWGIKVEGGEQ